MKYVNKLTTAIMVLTLFCTQTYAAGFAKYDGIKGESMPAKDQNHKKWINLESMSTPLEKVTHNATERRVDRIPKRIDMKWNNARNRLWKEGSTGGANDRPTEEVSFYFNKIPGTQPFPRPASRSLSAPNMQSTEPGKPQPIGLLLPAVQKVR